MILNKDENNSDKLKVLNLNSLKGSKVKIFFFNYLLLQ